MLRKPYDPTASAPMTQIVRVSVIVVTLTLFFAALFNAFLGYRDIAIMLALATPLGISAWGFARAGHNEAAMVLLCLVLVTVVTLILVLNPLGVHDVAITAYGGVVLVGALLLSRRSFYAVVGVTLLAATGAFTMEMLGQTRSVIARHSGWPQYVDFLVITMVFALLGRVAAEELFGSLGEAHHASQGDPVTGLVNRPGFLEMARSRLKAAAEAKESALLVVLDIDGFRRMNLVIGHQAGDHLLREVARRLALACGEHLLARIGDDEFAVLAMNVPEAGAEAFARKLHATLDFDYQGVSVRNAAGYARFPRDAHAIEALHLAAESFIATAKARATDRIAGPGDAI